jgi:membrane protein
MNYWALTKDSVKEFAANNPLRHSSSIAFYLVFSLPAILIISLSVAGSAFEDQLVRETLLTQIQNLYGPESSDIVQRVIENSQGFGSTWYAKAVGIIALLFSGTAIFVSLQDGLNAIWNVRSKPEKDLYNFLKMRLVSLGMVISLGVLLVISLAVDTAMSFFKELLTGTLSGTGTMVVSVLHISVTFILITVVFALVFKLLPDAKVHWRDVWLGAVVSTMLFTAGKYLIGFYLGNSSFGSVYGAAGSLVLLLVWVFYSATVLLYGSSFTFTYSKALGDNIEPIEHAVYVQEVEKDSEQVNA